MKEYPYQKAWETHRLKTAAGLILSVVLVAGFYFFAKYHKIFTRYVAVEIILGFFVVVSLLLLVFILRTHFWRCPRCFYKPRLFPFSGKYYEYHCRQCDLNKYEGSNYFDGKIKVSIKNL